MNIHEYQAKTLLGKFGVAVPRGAVAYTVKEAEDAAKDLGGPVWVVKSQIHAGGRGAGRFKGDEDGKGGVRVVRSVEEVRENADEMLGAVLVTKQTGPQGKEVKRLYIEEGCDIARELYLSLLVDRATSRITLMASTEGGMEIEEVAGSPSRLASRANRSVPPLSSFLRCTRPLPRWTPAWSRSTRWSLPARVRLSRSTAR
jgi:succinyl-CoA synthetase beta subunit